MTTTSSLRLTRRLLCLLGGSLLISSAFAPTWPTKPSKIILPFAAGGGGDTVMRPISQKLSEAL